MDTHQIISTVTIIIMFASLPFVWMKNFRTSLTLQMIHLVLIHLVLIGNALTQDWIFALVWTVLCAVYTWRYNESKKLKKFMEEIEPQLREEVRNYIAKENGIDPSEVKFEDEIHEDDYKKDEE